MAIRTLTLQSHGETPEQDAIITLAPHRIMMVAITGDVEREGLGRLKNAVILLDNEATLQFQISELDAFKLEQAVGAYMLE